MVLLGGLGGNSLIDGRLGFIGVYRNAGHMISQKKRESYFSSTTLNWTSNFDLLVARRGLFRQVYRLVSFTLTG
jgi:hypothetical protein